jgi:hypothetical protein
MDRYGTYQVQQAEQQPPAIYLDTLTVRATHELVEMITDPQPIGNPGWRSAKGEIADICESPDHNYTFWECGSTAYRVSSFWSEKRQQCVGCSAWISLEDESDCQPGIGPGQTVKLSAHVTCGCADQYRYEWEASGGAALAGSNRSQVLVFRTPPAPGDVTVTVTAMDTQHQTAVSATLSLHISTPEEISMGELWCQLMDQLRTTAQLTMLRPGEGPDITLGPFHAVCALWDPLRDFPAAGRATMPTSDSDVYALHEAATRLAQQTSELVRLHEALARDATSPQTSSSTTPPQRTGVVSRLFMAIGAGLAAISRRPLFIVVGALVAIALVVVLFVVVPFVVVPFVFRTGR